MKRYETSFDAKAIGIIPLRYAMFLSAFTFVCYIIAYATPFWFQSWPRVHSKFLKIGIWEACFAGFIHPADEAKKAYFGCWWIFSNEYQLIRYWLFPGWFICVQIFEHIGVLTCTISLGIHIWMYLQRKQKPAVNAAKWGLFFTTITGLFTAMTLLFDS